MENFLRHIKISQYDAWESGCAEKSKDFKSVNSIRIHACDIQQKTQHDMIQRETNDGYDA